MGQSDEPACLRAPFIAADTSTAGACA